MSSIVPRGHQWPWVISQGHSAILKLSIAKNYKYVHAHLDVMWTLLVLLFLVHRRHNCSRTITIHKWCQSYHVFVSRYIQNISTVWIKKSPWGYPGVQKSIKNSQPFVKKWKKYHLRSYPSHAITNFYSIIFKFNEVMPYKSATT